MDRRYQGIAQSLASKGRYGDTQLVHMNPIEVAVMEQMTPGGLTTNPDTGQKEAFAFLIPMLGGMAGSAALGGVVGTTAATALGAGAAQWAATGDLQEGIKSGIMGGIGAGIGSGIASGGTDFLGTATAPTSMLSGTETMVQPGPADAITGGMGPGGGGGNVAGQMTAPSPYNSASVPTGAGGMPYGEPSASLDPFVFPGTGTPTVAGDMPTGAGGMPYGEPSTSGATSRFTTTDLAAMQQPRYAPLLKNNFAPAPSGGPANVNPQVETNMLGLDPRTPAGQMPSSASEFANNMGHELTSARGMTTLALGAAGEAMKPPEYSFNEDEDSYYREEQFPDNPRSWKGSPSGYRPGKDPEYKYFAEGGIAQGANPQQQAMLGSGGYAPTEDSLIAETKAAIMGSHPEPQKVVQAFIERYGEQAFMQLRTQIVKAMAGDEGLTQGPGGGMDDQIPATIDGSEPAALSDGEFVVPADVVSGLGDGSTDAGADKLYNMLDKVRVDRTGTKNQPQQINDMAAMPV